MAADPASVSEGAWLQEPERGTELGIGILVLACRLVGRAGARAILFPVALWYALVGGTGVRASRAYLARMWPRVRFAMVVRHIRTFAECALDRVFLAAGRTELFQIERYGREHLRALARARRGAILLGAHVGSFEAMRAMSKSEGLRVNILAHFRNARRITAFLRRVAPDFDGRVIEIDPEAPHFVLAVAERIAAGELVAVLGDRTGLGEQAVTVDFLGGRARLPAGPYTLAAALGCPIYLTFGLYHRPRRYTLYCEPFADRVLLPREGREEALRALVQRFAHRLEYYVRLAPYDWFNFFEFWEKLEP